MEKSTLTEDKAEKTPTGGVLVGKREGQTIIHNKGTLSGYLVGKTHAEGGIKAVNKSTGQPLEMQGGEVVITAPAVSDNTKREFEGKMMTNREILSAINVKGGGVAFASGGDIPKKIKRTGASYKYGGKTMTDHEIYKYITGGGIAEDLSIRDIANIHQVPLAELKEEVRIGMIAESEHKADKKDQMEIVKDHLLENPKYYTLLKKAGLVEEDTAPLEKSKWLKQFYVTNNPSIDKLLKDLQPKINELIEKQKELAIKESTRIFGEPRPMSELDIQFYEAGLIFKMVQAFNKYLKNTDELYDVSIDKRGSLFEVNGKVKRDGRSYKFVTELIDAGGYNIQEYHYRYIIKTDLPSSNENSAVENIKAKMGVLKKIRTIDEDIARYSKYISESEKELMQGFREFKIQGLEHKRDLSDFDVEHNKKRIQDFNKEIQKLEGKKADLISVFESLDKKGVGANFGKQVKEAIGRRILVDRLQGSKYKETGDTLDFKIETRFNKNAKINTFSFLDEGNGLCTMKAGLELRGKYTPYAEYKNLPIKEIPYKINEIFNGDFSKYLEFKDGGVMEKENLVKDAKSGNTPARDLNNYNDVLDIDADGMVGAETSLYADGGMMKNGGLIAPNGNKSNLTPEQYKLVRTPEFKEWFGDWENDPENASKVVDENGEPMVVYHTTSAEFNIFSKKKSKEGFFFAPQKERLSVYNKSNINSYFLNLRNPSHEMFKSDLNYLIPKGYDGIMDYGHAKHLGNKNLYEIIAFEPNQIKLADGTNTTFDSSNPDIRYELGGIFHGSSYNFDKFTTSKMGSGIGQQQDGWGIYLTDNKEATKNYGKYIYETTLFKNKSLGEYNFIDLKKPVKKDIVTKIIKAVYKKFNKDFDIIEFNQYYDYVKDKSLPKVDFNDYDLVEFDYAGYLFYKTLSRILGGDKNASLFLLDNGIDGLKSSFENSKGVYRTDYVIFDENAITIENKEYLQNNYYATGGDVKPYDANMEGDSADMMFAEGGAVSSVVDNWDEVPSIWKNTSKVKKVAWTNSPYDKGLYSIIAPFLGNDDLRPIMTGINFDENGITVTNAHILITLPYPNKQFEGTYESDLSKRVSSEQITIDGKYPNYVPIIPESKNTVKYEVDVYKLLQYTNVAIKYANKTTYAVNYKIYDEIIGFNAKYLNQVLTTLLKLGHNKVYGHFVGYTKAFVFSSEKNYELGNDDILLIMPLVTEKKFYGAEDMLYGSNRKLSVYYDFNDNELHNADGSIAEFKMTYENNSVISKEDVTLLEKLANGKNRVPILDYVLVQNGVARATDLYSEYYLSGVALPDGIYKPNKGALEITMEAIDDFPTSPIFVTDEDTLQFVISSDIFEYYIDKLKYVVGTDDLREILKGICLHHTSDNKLFLVATDTHILLKVNITEYVDMPEVYKDMKFIIEPKRLYDFLNSTENTALTIKSNLVATSIQSDNWSFYARNIDGNYPNYEAVMPRETNKLAMVNLEPIKKAFNTEMVKNYVKEANQKDKVFIFNKENEIFIATYTSGDNIEKICETNVDFRLDDYFNENQSVLLFMPFGFDKQTNFAFRKDLLERVFKIVNDNKLELHYNELNRAYVIPIDTIEYKTTTKEHKVKEQKPSAEEIKLVSTINEINEIKEVIESLEILLENANRKDKKEIKETIEGLQILLDSYEY